MNEQLCETKLLYFLSVFCRPGSLPIFDLLEMKLRQYRFVSARYVKTKEGDI